jgi:hypothetical protein
MKFRFERSSSTPPEQARLTKVTLRVARSVSRYCSAQLRELR